MNYKYLATLANGDVRYLVSLNLYRDCFQSDVPLDDFIEIGVYASGTNPPRRYASVDAPQKGKGFVKPPGSVDCDFYARNVCIERGLYEAVITLPPRPQGYDLVFARCCRNLQTNIWDDGSGTPSQGQTYACHIPSHTDRNSSPAFSGVPSPYMCALDTTTFRFNAVDPDGDSLSYKLVWPWQGGSINDPIPSPTDPMTPIDDVLYRNANYSYQRPFGVNNGSISNVDRFTGLTTFFAPNKGSYVVAIEVTEWRDGKILSTVRLDLQILVLDCPPNERPSIYTDKGQEFTIEAGSKLCFNVFAKDPDGDLVKLSAEAEMLDGSNNFQGTKATFFVVYDQPSGEGEFCWDTDCDHARDEPYIVTVDVEDDGCPPKQNAIDFKIYVEPFVGADQIIGDLKVCRYNTYQYTAKEIHDNSTFEWIVENGSIVGPTDQSTIMVDWDGPNPGKITMTEISQYGCRGEPVNVNVEIVESPTLPIIQGKDTVCENELNLKYTVQLNNGNTYNWLTQNATIGTKNKNEITLSSYGIGKFLLKVVETNQDGCPSDTAYKSVFVSSPYPYITGPKTVCPNAVGIKYTAAGGSKSNYSWGVDGGVIQSGGNGPVVTVNWGNVGFGKVYVQETDRFGCVSPLVTLDIKKSYTLDPPLLLGPLDVCEFDMGVPYNSEEINGSSFYWNVIGGTQVAGDSSANILINWGATGNGNVSLQQIAYDLPNDTQCISPVVDIDVVIHPKPVADEIIGTMEMCQYEDTFTYTLNGYVDSDYEWAIDGDATNIIGQGTNSIKIFWDTPGTFTISVEETTIAGCLYKVIDTLVLVNPKPVTTPIVGPDTICPEDALGKLYSVTGFATSIFNWEVYGERSFTGQGTNAISVNWEETLSGGLVKVVEVSDKGCVGDTQVREVFIDRLAIDMKVASVGTPDNKIYLSWYLSEISYADFFYIQRYSSTSGDWVNIATVAGNVFEYTDEGLNTDIQAYQYRIASNNQCGTLIFSEPHTVVLLEGTKDDDFNIHLNFSEYLGWIEGVNRYEIYESSNYGPYYNTGFIGTPGDELLLENDPNQFIKCYRVYAIEENGELARSWSNEICFTFSPELFVPNAFTPNGDRINDGFGVKGIAIKDYNIKIYNRWGEKLFESDDMDDKWIPIYRGLDVPVGTYVYLINFTDFEDKLYTRTGTINLIR